LPTRRLALPFDFSPTAHNFFHPQPYTRRQAHGEWYQTLEGAAEHLAHNDRGNENANAENAGALLQSRKGGLIADRRSGVEKNVSLLAMNRYVGGGSLGDWVWWCGHVLIVLVVFERLVGIRLDGLKSVSTRQL
jgi:hypothetical protein